MGDLLLCILMVRRVIAFLKKEKTLVIPAAAVLGVVIIVLGGVSLFSGEKSLLAGVFKGGITPTPTVTPTPTIIFEKDVLGAQEEATPTPTVKKTTSSATPTKKASTTSTPTPVSSSNTPTPTNASATSTPTPTNGSSSTTDDKSLYLSPNSQTISNGSNLTVELRMNSSENINAISAKISYPTDLLEFQTIEVNGVFEVQAQSKAEGGVVMIDRGTMTPVSGDKPIVKITFKTKSAGSASLSFNDGSIVSSSSNTNIIQKKNGGTYTIQ